MDAPVITGTPGDGKVDLRWNAVAGAAMYRVLRGPAADSVKVIGTQTTALTYIDSGLTNGTTYWYSVRGVAANWDKGPNATPISLTPNVPAPPPSIQIMGHGSAAVGGKAAASPTIVTSIAQFRAAAAQSGPRRLYLRGDWYDDGGAQLNIDKPFISIFNDGWKGLKRSQLQVKASEVILDGFRSWPGDQVNAPDDTDGISILGPSGSGFIEKIALLRSSFFFASDVALTVLRDVRDSTIADCMIGLGLYRSRHKEADGAGEDHSYAANFSSLQPSFMPFGKRMTVWRTLFLHSDGRMPQTWEFEKIDFINCVMYNPGRNGWVGNPRAMNGVNNIIRSGPQSTSNSKKIWRGTQHEGQPWFGASVYLSGNVADGFTPSISYGPGTQRSTPWDALSVAPVPPDLEWVLSNVGPPQRNSLELQMLDHVRNRTSPGFFNGAAFPAPNPVWP